MFELRSVVGYEGLYSVTRDGKVWSEARVIDRKGYAYRVQGRFLKQLVGTHGYHTVMLSKGGVTDRVCVHRLVAEAWLPRDRDDAVAVNHKNGVKTDNRLDNLEWVTTAENTSHAYLIGLKKPTRKRTENEVKEIRRRLAAGEPQRKIAIEFGMSQQSISDIARRKVYRSVTP